MSPASGRNDARIIVANDGSHVNITIYFYLEVIFNNKLIIFFDYFILF